MSRLFAIALSIVLVTSLAWAPGSLLQNASTEVAYGAPNETIKTSHTNDTGVLINALVQEGIEVVTASTKGAMGTYDGQLGVFTDGGSVFGIDRGIILGTGGISSIQPTSPQKPNNQTNMTTRYFNQDTDPDLAPLVELEIRDRAVLEFSFIPETPYFTFEYVFASDEYNEYVDKGYNDVFGFFINGVNYALVPGTNDIVSVDSINFKKNTDYYINNTPWRDVSTHPIVETVAQTEMDGFTVVMTIQAYVMVGEVNTIKLAIADVNDDKFDSNVLISGMRSEYPAVSLVEPTVQSVYETAGSVTFTLERDITLGASTVDFVITEDTAKAGVDYTDVSGSVTFADGEATKTVTIPITNRSGSYQGDRSFLVELQDPIDCRIVEPSEGMATILDTDIKPVTYTITEKFVDTYGNAVDSTALPNRLTEVENSFTATTFPLTHTPLGGATYAYLGYKVGSYTSGDALASGTPVNLSVSSPLTITYVYQAARPLTLSKMVAGDFASHTQPYTFTLYFQDHNSAKLPIGTWINYTGEVVAGSNATPPASGTLTLDHEGKSTISLKHGQAIRLTGLALGHKVRIVETSATGYTASYVDNIVAAPVTSPDTGYLDITDADRAIVFTNTFLEVPPTGIADHDTKMPMLAIAAAFMLAGGMIAARNIYRGRRADRMDET